MGVRGARTQVAAVVAVVLALVVLAGLSGSATAVPSPVEMTAACALKSNGLMRYVTSTSQCTKNETAVPIKPGPHLLCIQPTGSVRKVSNFNQCKAPATQLTIPPTSGTVYFCAANSTGVLRYVTDPSQCTATEFAVFVTPNDAAPSVSSTSPANGATNVAVNPNIVVTFSESVSASGSSFTLECPSGTPKSFTVSGSPGSSITLDPTANLPEGTTCAVKVIASQISDTDANDPPDHMAADYNFSFTTDSAPSVTSTSPADGATAVSASTNVTVTFSEPVNASAASFTIECPSGSPQSFGVTGSGTSTITLDPTSDLPGATNCTVTVLANGITDVDGGDPPDNLAANYVFSFTTADAAPSVTSTSPADGALHNAVDTNVVVNFSEPVTATGSSFTLECPAGTPRSFAVSGSPGSSITLDPTSNLPEGTICSVKVIASEISDVDSVDPPDHMTADYSFSFTADAAPAVTATTPADGATNVDPSANITVDFSEPVDVTTSSFTIACPGTQTFAVSGSGTSSITLDPDSDLPSTASCTVTAVAANISDSDTGDPPDHPAANTSFSFTTQDAAPSVTSTSPADGATDVARNSDVDITFNEAVTATANAFTLECPAGSPIAYTPSGSPGTTLTLDPAGDLPPGTTCTVKVIAAEISDVDSVDPPDHMAADYTFSFTVAANQAPTDIALSPASVDENEPSGTAVGTFSTTDPDAGDTFTYALVAGTGSADNGSFTIDGDTLKTDEVFDFETKSSYSIRVQSTDSGSLSFEKVFTITVNDVNEAPTDIALSNNDIDENQPSGTTIGALTATDPDTGQTHTFSLQNSGCSGSFPDNSSFQIVGGDLKSAVSFNYEVKNSYTICVRATDGGTPNLSFDEQFTIAINDVNDAPVGVADSYSGAIGNTLAVLGTSGSGPHVVLTGNVLTNNDSDEDVPAQPLSAVAETNASTGGGTATIGSDGSFTFLPGVGDKNQNDTFTYHVTDGIATSAGTVTVGIANFLVWYVNNASAAATHDGRSPSPFLNLASLNGAGGSGDSDGTGDYIFLYQGSGSYGGGIPLEANQNLWGEKHGLTVNGNNLVAAGAIAPVVTNGSGTGVGLANGADVQGLNISGTSGDAINGAAVTTASVGTTTAVNVSSAGGDGVDLSGAASGNISIASPITGSAGHSVAVSARSGGTVAFSGAISDTGTGISLNGNTGATINFTGGITSSTGASNAFFVNAGGTVNVTGSANTLATTTGTALNVANTTIGASGLTFQSIAANGAANGIVLNNTGSTAGLTVTGNGGTCTSTASTCTGGTIQSTTGHGISLTSTLSPSLSFMKIMDIDLSGIYGTGVTNFTLANSVVDGVNTNHTGADANVAFNANAGGASENNVSGTVSITNNHLNNSYQAGVDIQNYSGTISTLTITGNTLSSSTSAASSLGTAINVVANRSASNHASITAGSISGNTIQNFPSGAGIQVIGGNSLAGQAVTVASLGSPLLIQDNTITGAGAGSAGLGTNGIAVTAGESTAAYFTIGQSGHPNTITNVRGNGIACSLFGNGTEKCSIASNVINANNTAGSPGINTGADQSVAGGSAGVGTLYLDIHDNTVSNTTGNGILSTLRSVSSNGVFRIQNNNVAQPTALSGTVYGIRADSGNGLGAPTLCLKISGNTTAGSTNGAITAPGIGLRQSHADPGGGIGTFNIDGLTPNPSNDAQMQLYVGNLGQNPGSANGTFGANGVASISSGATYHAGTCTIP
jgi:large repetitive protein